MEPFAGGGLVVEVQQVELFEQQQGLVADELSHVEGGGFLSGHGDFSGTGDKNGVKPGVMRFRAWLCRMPEIIRAVKPGLRRSLCLFSALMAQKRPERVSAVRATGRYGKKWRENKSDVIWNDTLWTYLTVVLAISQIFYTMKVIK
ncbi:hypothetical protein [Enterobacter sp. 166D1]|uniref:hypothetical protein n=1 Tax=Enterobacter TaxID=547 RepID=UPI002A81AFCA|nr:hypothetical protein [Enterobacter sp. 166D1]